ncbi:MAG: hypothetical protein ACKOHK_06585 [Planctomycetia bacterium]
MRQSSRRNFGRRDFGHIEQLESRAVLSAVSVAIMPPAVQDGSSVVAPSLPGSPVAAARLVLRVPPQVEAGAPTPIIATAIDAAGRPVTSFSGSAFVSSTDGAAALPMIEVQFKDGRASFEVTFATAGTQTVSVRMLGDDPAGRLAARASTVVTAPQTLSSFRVSVPPRATAGTAIDASIVAVDAAGRPLNRFSGTATLASADSAATLPASVKFVNGRATARVTFGTAGSQSLSVRGGAGEKIVTTAATEVVAPRVATTFAVVLPKAVPVGVPVLVTIVATDAQGRRMPTFSGTATLSSSDSAAKLPSSVRFVAGQATARVTFGTLGEQTLTAFRVWSGPNGAISGTGKTQVGEVSIQRR